MTWMLLAGWLVASAVIFRLVVFGDRRIHRDPRTFAEVAARLSAEMREFSLAFGAALKPAMERATEAFVRFGRALGGEE